MIGIRNLGFIQLLDAEDERFEYNQSTVQACENLPIKSRRGNETITEGVHNLVITTYKVFVLLICIQILNVVVLPGFDTKHGINNKFNPTWI